MQCILKAYICLKGTWNLQTGVGGMFLIVRVKTVEEAVFEKIYWKLKSFGEDILVTLLYINCIKQNLVKLRTAFSLQNLFRGINVC